MTRQGRLIEGASEDTGEALEPISALEKRLGLRFSDRGLIQRALTHRSYLNEVEDPDVKDNERLEFLGDALLGFAVAEDLHALMPDAPEGELTSLRSALVRESALADYARTLRLGAHIRMGRGEATSGGRERDGLLCDVFESVLGAILLEHGTEVARRFALDFVRVELDKVLEQRSAKDAKSALQELVQGRWRITPSYRTIHESGPDHDKRFVVQILIDEGVWGEGEGSSKAEAARAAAQAALEALATADDETQVGAGAVSQPADAQPEDR